MTLGNHHVTRVTDYLRYEYAIVGAPNGCDIEYQVATVYRGKVTRRRYAHDWEEARRIVAKCVRDFRRTKCVQ